MRYQYWKTDSFGIAAAAAALDTPNQATWINISLVCFSLLRKEGGKKTGKENVLSVYNLDNVGAWNNFFSACAKCQNMAENGSCQDFLKWQNRKKFNLRFGKDSWEF